LLLSTALAPTAHAQINLAWNDCITKPGAAANIDYACDGSRNGHPFRLVASFIAPIDLPEFVGTQMVIGLASMLGSEGPNLAPMTDWWRLGIGECRDGNLIFPAPTVGMGNGATGACQNPFLGAFTAGGFEYTYGPNNPDRVRLVTAFARDTPIALTKGQQYLAGVITLDTIGDVAGDGVAICTGCCERRAIILDQMELYQVAGQTPPQQDILVLTAAATRQHVMWQDHENCVTPTHRVTWGSIKATYR